MIFIFFISFLTKKNNGYDKRFDDKILNSYNKFNFQEKIFSECRNKKVGNFCIHGNKINPEFIAWGDSHLNQLSNQLNNLALSKNKGLIEISFTGCPPIINLKRIDKLGQDCTMKSDEVLDFILKKKPKYLILHAYWKAYLDDKIVMSVNNLSLEENFKLQVQEITKNDIKIIIILGIPEMNTNPKKNYFRQKLNNTFKINNFYKTKKDHFNENKINRIIFKNLKSDQVILIDPADTLCKNNLCKSLDGEKLLYRDNSHISKINSEVLLDQLKIIFE